MDEMKFLKCSEEEKGNFYWNSRTTVPYLTLDIRFRHSAAIEIDWPCIM